MIHLKSAMAKCTCNQCCSTYDFRDITSSEASSNNALDMRGIGQFITRYHKQLYQVCNINADLAFHAPRCQKTRHVERRNLGRLLPPLLERQNQMAPINASTDKDAQTIARPDCTKEAALWTQLHTYLVIRLVMNVSEFVTR